MSLKVLVVDDDEVVIFLHKMMVEDSGLSPEPISFKDGKAAIEYLNEQYKEGDFYLILLDINMPVMNGWEFLDAIQTMPFSNLTSVVMVTSSIDSIDRDKAKQYTQVIDYIEKPLNLDTCNRIKCLPQIAGLF